MVCFLCVNLFIYLFIYLFHQQDYHSAVENSNESGVYIFYMHTSTQAFQTVLIRPFLSFFFSKSYDRFELCYWRALTFFTFFFYQTAYTQDGSSMYIIIMMDILLFFCLFCFFFNSCFSIVFLFSVFCFCFVFLFFFVFFSVAVLKRLRSRPATLEGAHAERLDAGQGGRAPGGKV